MQAKYITCKPIITNVILQILLQLYYNYANYDMQIIRVYYTCLYASQGELVY